MYTNLRAGLEGRTGIFHRKIAVSAEIKKKNRDWLSPWPPRGHSQFFVFKKGCSVLWTSGQRGFFSQSLSVSDLVLFCWQIKSYCTQHWRLLVTFFDLFWTNWEKWSRFTTEEGCMELKKGHTCVDFAHLLLNCPYCIIRLVNSILNLPPTLLTMQCSN